MGSKKYEIDMCSGSLFKQILIFTVPLMLSSILQLLYNAADIIVVGQYSGNFALAAVGSTGALTNLIVNMFVGLSIGANVMVARYFGAKDFSGVARTVHTAIYISFAAGIVLAIFGIVSAKYLLSLMGTPSDVLDYSTLYMRIYFLGMPAFMVYNFGSSILRALGDTKRPLYFLTISGLVNIALNLFFVIVLHMSVDGVAIATIISQYISAALVINCLIKSDGCYHLDVKQLKIHKYELVQMIKIGFPAGIQGSIFSISNVLIQSSVNSFGSVTMAGNTSAANLEGFVYVAMNAFHQAAVSFTGQNYGAKKFERLGKIVAVCSLFVMIFGGGLSALILLFKNQLLGIYTPDPAVVQIGIQRLQMVCSTYFLCGLMEVFVGGMRGLGYSVMPMLISIFGACGLRIIWIYTVFAIDRNLSVLYLSYPVSWFITTAVHLLCYLVIKHNVIKREKTAAAAVS